MVDWNTVDWTLNNGQISRLIGVSKKTVWKKRNSLGIQRVTTPGRCAPENRFKESWKSSPVTKPINDLDYEFAISISKGKRRPNSSFRRAVIRLLGPECRICGYYRLPISNHVHHIIPLSKGGPNSIRNGIILCSRCHEEVHAGLLTIPSPVIGLSNG